MDIRTLQYFLAVAREESISGSSRIFTYDAATAFKAAQRTGSRAWQTAFYPREPQNNSDGRWYDPAQKSRRNRCPNGKNQS